jgi:hypothetical protein
MTWITHDEFESRAHYLRDRAVRGPAARLGRARVSYLRPVTPCTCTGYPAHVRWSTNDAA